MGLLKPFNGANQLNLDVIRQACGNAIGVDFVGG